METTDCTEDGDGLTRRDALARGGAAFAAITLSSVLAACGNDKSDTEDAAPRGAIGTLIVAVDQDINSWDPQYAFGSPATQTAIVNTFDQLVQLKPVDITIDGTSFRGADSQQFLPMLAESWSVDGDSIAYKLRSGLKFSNGSVLDAHAVEAAYAREFVEGNAGAFLLGLVAVPKLSDITAVDARTLRIKTTGGAPGPLMQQIHATINLSLLDQTEVAKHATKTDPAANGYFTKRPPAGSGPYKVTEQVAGDHITLEAVPGWYGGTPKLKKVIHKFVPDATQRGLLLLRGDVDVLFHPAVADLDRFAKDPNVKVLSIPTPRQYLFDMNIKLAPFDDLKVRQAVLYAIPYDSIVKDIFKGRANRMKSFVPEGMPSSDDSGWLYETDLDKAKQTLSDAGHAGGKGLAPVEIAVSIGPQEDTQTAVLLQSVMKSIGIRTSVKRMPIGPYSDQRTAKKLQCDIFNSLWFVNDPWFAIGLNQKSDGVSNYFNYANRQVDALYDKWADSGDAEGRLEGSREAQRLITADAPMGYLCSPNYNIAMRKNVEGFVRYPDELTRYASMSKTA